jgi:hypothetical protein
MRVRHVLVAFGLGAALAVAPVAQAATYDGSPETIVGSPVCSARRTDGSTPMTAPRRPRVQCRQHLVPVRRPPEQEGDVHLPNHGAEDRAVMANGDLLGHWTSGDHATYVWNETSPMATYLVTIDIGHWPGFVLHRPVVAEEQAGTGFLTVEARTSAQLG